MAKQRCRIEDFFVTGEDFESMLEEAEAECESVFQRDFCLNLRSKWDNYGMRCFLSEQQYGILREIAGYSDED